ncbi:hypothetical protein [Yinghuangia soli]|uniref:Uncharacterized protein n=1 Tax=Yinghuangia soli TaxID=2908204 RepID=A0AA41U095_9ACTN|nr:hypothetical protein [Yinghuangia soli]MCF2526202.1 hypothetical protein [Yinghuangia soli]
MSMWLTLVKTDPARAEEVRRTPDSAAALLDDESSSDAHGEDFRALGDIAEGRAEAEEGTVDWMDVYPALAQATGEGCTALEGDHGHDYVFVLTAAEVAAVTTGLAAEGWTGFLEIARFYEAAATEGRAVVGGIA